MLIVAIILLAVVLFALLFRRKPNASAPDRRDDGIIFGETPGGLWMGGPLPGDASTDDVTPGGGDFGGGGSSGSWDDSDGGDGGGD